MSSSCQTSCSTRISNRLGSMKWPQRPKPVRLTPRSRLRRQGSGRPACLDPLYPADKLLRRSAVIAARRLLQSRKPWALRCPPGKSQSERPSSDPRTPGTPSAWSAFSPSTSERVAARDLHRSVPRRQMAHLPWVVVARITHLHSLRFSRDRALAASRIDT
jgi:hypothetical protein